MKKLVLFLLVATLALLSGCKTKTVYVPVETTKYEYRDRFLHDSINIHDSTVVQKLGDTVYFSKFKNVYLYRYLRDTISRQDTIRVPYPVVNNVEVNKLKWWQEACCWFTGVVLLLLLLYLGFKYKAKIISFFGKLIFKI